MAAVSSGMVTVRFNDMLYAAGVKTMLHGPGPKSDSEPDFDLETVDLVAGASLDCCYGQRRRRAVSHAFKNCLVLGPWVSCRSSIFIVDLFWMWLAVWLYQMK